MSRIRCFWLASLIVLAAIPASAQAPEFSGEWQLQPELCLGPAPRRESFVLVSTPTEQHYTMEYVDQEGRSGRVERVLRYDGTDQPVSQNLKDTVSLRRLDASTEILVNKTSGEVTSTLTRLLVDEGRTLLSISRLPDGRVSWVRVFARRR